MTDANDSKNTNVPTNVITIEFLRNELKLLQAKMKRNKENEIRRMSNHDKPNWKSNN